jgi:hypothetical protein
MITTDLWVDVEPDTAFAYDVRVLDDEVEIVIGSQVSGRDCLHLSLPDLETCTRLVEVITKGRDEFASALQKGNRGAA